MIEFSDSGSELTITTGTEKYPKPIENKEFWAVVPVTGLDLHFHPLRE